MGRHARHNPPDIASPRGSDPLPDSDHAYAASTLSPTLWDHALSRPAAFTFLTFFLAWMMLVFAVWTTWPAQDHGTRMADSNIMNAARNYDAHGLFHHHAVPNLETYEDAERPPTLYPTYPPGPYWIHALLRRAGLHDLSELRGASVVGSTIAGLLALATFSVLTRSWFLGSLAAFFYTFSAPFTGYADSIHMNVWMQIGLFCFLLAWVGFERIPAPWRWACLALAALAYFLEIWITLEHIALIALIVAARTVLSRRWSIWIGASILAAVCLLGLASRVWHLTPEYATVDAALDRLIRKYLHRSGEGGPSGTAGVPIREVVNRWLDQLYWSDNDAPRQSEFGYPLLHRAVLACAAGLLATMFLCRIPWMRASIQRARRRAADIARSLGRAGPHARLSRIEAIDALHDARLPTLRATRAGLGWGALLLLASLHWHVAMRQHAAIHPHVILNMLPGMALILGSLAAGGLRLAMPDSAGTSWVRWIGLPLSIALIAVFTIHLRHSAVLNRPFRLDPIMHAQLRSRETANQWWRDLGDALRRRYEPVRRVVLFHWGPPQANLMDLPHQYVEAGKMPESFGLPAPGTTAPPSGADLLLIEFPRRDRTPQVILEQGFDRFGLPEIQQGPEATALIFSTTRWPDAAPTLDCDIRLAGGLRIEHLRLSESITGDAWVVCFLVRGPNAAALSPTAQGSPPPRATRTQPSTLAAVVTTFDEQGERTGLFTPRLSRRATYRNLALVWAIIDKPRLTASSTIRIALTPEQGQTRESYLQIEQARALPPGVSVDLQHNQIVWRLTP